VLRHQLGQNLIFGLDLLRQILNAFPLGLMVGARFRLEGRRPVLEDFLLPPVEDRWLKPQFIAQLRDRLVIQQMPPQNGYFLLGLSNDSASFSCALSVILTAERSLHFQLRQNNPTKEVYQLQPNSMGSQRLAHAGKIISFTSCDETAE